MKTTVIIPAAGMGTRMGCQKQLLPINGIPALFRTLEIFSSHEEIDEIILVAPRNISVKHFTKITAIVDGGSDRQASVYEGLKALSAETVNVLIHDGARPLVTPDIIADILSYVRRGQAAISGVRSKDTIKITGLDNKIESTPHRDNTWLVQTPQGFPKEVILAAHKKAIEEGFSNATDDGVLVERLGTPVFMVEGDYANIKLTTPQDIKIAEALLHMRDLDEGH